MKGYCVVCTKQRPPSLFLISHLESLEENELKAMADLEKANKEIT